MGFENNKCKTTPSNSRFERTCIFPVSEDSKRGNSMICNECDNKGYTLEWNASFDGNIKVRCYSCLANEQHKNDVAKRLAKLFMESSPQKNAYYLADILVTASINKDELENIESFIESKSKDALYVLLNHVV